MDALDIYMTMAAGSVTVAAVMFDEGGLAFAPGVLCLFAAYCIVMGIRSLAKGKRR